MTPLFQVDAFTDRAFAGNPAAVCLLEEPADEAWMQRVGNEMNLSETAFVVPDEPSGGTAAAFRLRWFTPTVEVDLCGHATLASSHVLWSEGRVAARTPIFFATRSGVLTAVQADGGLIELDLPANPPEECPVDPAIVEAVGVIPVRTGGTANRWTILEVASEAEVAAASPRFDADAGWSAIVTARVGDEVVCRVFVPGAGIPEDPATGAAQCVLAPWWVPRLGGDRYLARQLSARGAVLHVRLEGDRVKVGGHAVTTLRGELVA